MFRSVRDKGGRRLAPEVADEPARRPALLLCAYNEGI